MQEHDLEEQAIPGLENVQVLRETIRHTLAEAAAGVAKDPIEHPDWQFCVVMVPGPDTGRPCMACCWAPEGIPLGPRAVALARLDYRPGMDPEEAANLALLQGFHNTVGMLMAAFHAAWQVTGPGNGGGGG